MLAVENSQYGVLMRDPDGYVRGWVLRETFGRIVTFSWRYYIPGVVTSQVVMGGSADTLDEAIAAIQQCAITK